MYCKNLLMKRIKKFIFAQLVIIGLLGMINSCQKARQPVLAKIGEAEIKVGDFISTLPKGQNLETPDEINSRYQSHLTKLINRHLFIQEAKRRGFTQKAEPSFELYKKTMLVNKLKNQAIKEKAKVTQPEVKKLYDILPVDVHLKVITVPTQAEAESVEKQLKEGTSFEDCARKFSRHPSGTNGGDVGFGKLAFLPAPIRNVLKTLKPGDLTNPIQTYDGYYIIQLVDKNQVAVKSFEAEEFELRKFLEQQKAKELHYQFFAQLNSRLTYNNKALQVFNQPVAEITEEEKELWVVKKDETLMVRVKSLLPVAEKFNPAIGAELRAITIKKEIEDDMIYQEAKQQGLDQDPAFIREMNNILDDLLYQVLYEEEIAKPTSVSESEILAYFDNNKSNYPTGWNESVRSIIQNRILTERKNSAEKLFTERLATNTKIEINQPLLKSLINSEKSEKEQK
jgi:peptidyl-prolyl cis-trans isomerase C